MSTARPSIALGRQPVGADEPLGKCPRPQLGRRQMVMVQVAQDRCDRIRVGPGQAGAAEHQPDLVAVDIVGDAAPQELHHRAGAVGGLDAGAAKLHQLADRGGDPGEIELGAV